MSERRSFIAFGIALLVAVFAGLAVFLLMGGSVGFGTGDDESLSRAEPIPESSASPRSAGSVGAASSSPSPTPSSTASPTSTADDPRGIEATPSPTAVAASASPTASPPTSTPTTPEATAPPPSVTPQAGPPPSPTATPQATPTASPTPAPSAAEPFTGTWRIVDTVRTGSGTGSTFTFDVVLTQAGSVLSGGGSSIQVVGTVEGNTAQVQFAQPAQGYTGTFTWALSSADRATGTFTTAGVNSGVSELVRLD